MKLTITIAVIGLFVFITTPVQADLVELDLLALGCPTYHDFDTPLWSYDIDLGVQFSSIDHVYMDWSGEITGGLFTYLGNPNGPQPANISITAKLGSYPSYYRQSSHWAGESTYPNPEPFNEQSEFLKGDMPLSELFDGQETIEISYDETLDILGDYWFVEHGSISLNKAKYVIDGTIIPEPSSFLIIGLGGLILKTKRRK